MSRARLLHSCPSRRREWLPGETSVPLQAPGAVYSASRACELSSQAPSHKSSAAEKGVGRRVIHFLSRLWFAGFSSITDSLSPAPLSLLRGEDGDSVLHTCVSPGTLDGSGKGAVAESQIHYSHTEHVWAGCCSLVLGYRLGDGDSCIGTFLRDFGGARWGG